MRIQDPTAPFAGVVAIRRRARAESDGERFRLGVHGLRCGGAATDQRRALVGASSWALKTERVEETVRVIGTAGGLLADLGFQVCPIGADDAGSVRPSLIVWVCGNETQADEYLQLRDLGVPGISLGSCVDGLDDWSYLEDDEIADRATFTRYFAAEATRLADEQNVSNNLSNEPRRTAPDDAGRRGVDKAPDLHQRGRRRTHPDDRGPSQSGS